MSEQISLPQGFLVSGVACGIKADPSRLDLALFAGQSPCSSAGVFTQNRICGAPVKVSRQRVPRATTRAVIINSGNANACTGQQGINDARWMTQQVAQSLNCSEDDVLVCSTGVIGHFLPCDKIAAGIPSLVDKLADTPDAFSLAAQAILTTDTCTKQSVREMEIAGATVRVSGVAKGAAMIGPNMATMLSAIMTDAELAPADADRMLRHAVARSFNCISVEGHTSTSDSVILLASGAAKTGLLTESDQTQLQVMVDEVAEQLAQAIVHDAEGGSHFITIEAKGLPTEREANLIVKTIANDGLVKTALAGNDPNWGRIVSCCGRTGVELTEQDITLRINEILVFEAGSPVAHDAQAVSESMRSSGNVHFELTFSLGTAAARFWTSDLTQEYVRLNSEYTT